MFDYIESVIKPDRFKKPNHLKLFKFIARVFEIFKNDCIQTIFNFFPFLSDKESLEKHRVSFFIPQYNIDTEKSIRDRVSMPFFYLERIGEKKSLDVFLDIFFKDRYRYIEFPRQIWRIDFNQIGIDSIFGDVASIYLYIKNLTIEEYQQIYDFLDNFLDPDIIFSIIGE